MCNTLSLSFGFIIILFSNHIKVRPAATDDQVERVTRRLRLWFDPELSAKDVKSTLPKRPLFTKFLDTHCKQHKYFFSIQKCDGCEWCTTRRDATETHHLPTPVLADDGEHYRPFAVSVHVVELFCVNRAC